MVKLLLILLSALLMAPNFIDVNINKKNEYNHKEEFSPQLDYIKSLDQLEQHTDSIATAQHIGQSSADYFILLETIIAERFYHGFSHYRLKHNWIAAVSERLIGYGLACKVNPEDILQSKAGACSQQAAVMMAIAKRKHVDYRSVGFPHHYAMEVNVNGCWYFLDPNMEPLISKEQRMEESWHGRSDELKQFYDADQHGNMDYAFGTGLQPNYGSVNANPAPRLKIFHSITWLLSRTIWCLPLMLAFAKRRRTSPSAKPAYYAEQNLFPLLPA
ncbi:hypothetical protein [Ferruginibacter sp. HRS2-29]|uniref:hypothetical protein n=1 Tax=Ferruginibacter sp. HRS2-29 TaxID=2487334 RepID=UPI0020CC6739|nr:hypothetical protein [Ferruginibacter sp. HRS2-29]MCP9752905.1 hypothetical protein [Ferruginibacter sp. HRS2-29]